MIPKKIHYCWFGGNPLPPLALKCIDSWKKYLPDYEIIEWNESNYDVHKIPYIAQAYDNKKYAFVSDYARFDILYQYGGLYFDTDVEVIKDMTEIINTGSFLGMETISTVNPGLGMGCIKEEPFYKKILDSYQNKKFLLDSGELNTGYTIVHRTSDLLKKDGLKEVNEKQSIDGINIYPKEYFCPKDVRTLELKVTENSYTIHHFDASWVNKHTKKMMIEKQWINEKISNKVLKTIMTKLVVLKKVIMCKLDKKSK